MLPKHSPHRQHPPAQYQPTAPQALPSQIQSPVQPQQVVIPLTITIGKEFKNKIPFLVGLFLLFSFSLVMFDKSNLKTMDLTDMQRVQYNIPKLYSVSFILFLVLVSFSLALAIYFSLSLGWAAGLLVVPATFLPALVMGASFYPWLLTAFLVFATVISFAAIVSSVWHKLSLSRAWAVLSASMLLFSLLAFFVVFTKIAVNKDAHVTAFLDTFAQSEMIKNQIYSLPAFKIVYDRFAFLTAAIAALIASVIGFIIQLLALVALFALERLVPMPES